MLRSWLYAPDLVNTCNSPKRELKGKRLIATLLRKTVDIYMCRPPPRLNFCHHQLLADPPAQCHLLGPAGNWIYSSTHRRRARLRAATPLEVAHGAQRGLSSGLGPLHPFGPLHPKPAPGDNSQEPTPIPWSYGQIPSSQSLSQGE